VLGKTACLSSGRPRSRLQLLLHLTAVTCSRCKVAERNPGSALVSPMSQRVRRGTAGEALDAGPLCNEMQYGRYFLLFAFFARANLLDLHKL
jgi:hypothetical protein